LGRHEFLLRRLHSLTGLVPVGAYVVIHLLSNATVLDGPGTFQRTVYIIHNLGILLPVVEWVFIFIPILFHATLGVVIITGSLPNNSAYRYVSNYRYTLQRASGMIAFLFILVHVFHMHGWFHIAAWERTVTEPLGGGQFRAYNAASSTALALQDVGWQLFYFVGVVAVVFHLANGIWTMGITWGVWVSPAAQRRASWACLGFGLLLGAIGLSALFGAVTVDIDEARDIEDRMYKARIEAGELQPAPRKRHERLETETEYLPGAEAAP
jgi:succinate dehydrogenase / fumarate reductase, cytochrome b subunit